MFGHGDLRWASPTNGETFELFWRDGLVCDEPSSLVSAVPRYDLAAYDETAVILGELKRLIRYEADLALETAERTWNASSLAEFFRTGDS